MRDDKITLDDMARALAAALVALEGLCGDDVPVGTMYAYADDEEARLAVARNHLFLLECHIKDCQERLEALRDRKFVSPE
jgi:hypothetical protein